MSASGMDIRSRFGRRLGVLNHALALTLLRLGLLREFESVDWARVNRLVFVCKGNICRSPFAAAVSREVGIDAVSCGLEAMPGGSAYPGATLAADRLSGALGDGMRAHRTTPFSAKGISERDLIVCFEPEQARRVRATSGRAVQVTLLGLYSRHLRPHVEDPYGLSEAYFDHCFELIEDAVRAIARMTIRARGPVLVVQAETLGAIAVIRSLGRAGYAVHASSSDTEALGLRSRYLSNGAISPTTDDPGYVEWLAEYVSRHQVKVIVPSEGLLLAIRDSYEKFQHLLPYSLESRVTYCGLSKFDLFASALARPDGPLADNIPPTILVDLEDQTVFDEVLAQMPSDVPLFIKVDGIRSKDGHGGLVRKVEGRAAAVGELRTLRAWYSKAIVQAYVPGVGVGACFVIWNGQVVGEAMHRRLHEVPHTGGISSYRKTIVHEDIRADALERLRALQWNGPAMMEYRLELATGRFHLMELNGRFWGSLHLALFAKSDLPRQLVDAFLGAPADGPPTYQPDVRCRLTFPAEVQHLWSMTVERNVTVGKKLAALCTFVILGMNPAVHSDLWFPGDRALYWRSMRRSIRHSILGLARRLASTLSD